MTANSVAVIAEIERQIEVCRWNAQDGLETGRGELYVYGVNGEIRALLRLLKWAKEHP